MTEANAAGISELDFNTYLVNNQLNDFYIENLKIRLGIIDKKPPRSPRKKTLAINHDPPGV